MFLHVSGRCQACHTVLSTVCSSMPQPRLPEKKRASLQLRTGIVHLQRDQINVTQSGSYLRFLSRLPGCDPWRLRQGVSQRVKMLARSHSGCGTPAAALASSCQAARSRLPQIRCSASQMVSGCQTGLPQKWSKSFAFIASDLSQQSPTPASNCAEFQTCSQVALQVVQGCKSFAHIKFRKLLNGVTSAVESCTFDCNVAWIESSLV